MKLEEKQEALRLRQQGYSINEIKNLLRVSKSSVSVWVRNIELSENQKKELSKKGLLKSVIEQRRNTRLMAEQTKRKFVIDLAVAEIKRLTAKELWLVGTMLYWAEGSKKRRDLVKFSNSDPEMIKLMMAFFRRICKVPEDKFRGHIHIHPHLNYKAAEKHWSKIAQIPLKKLYKTYRSINKASKNKKDSLPYGTFDIIICDTHLFLKIYGWVIGIFNSY